MHRKFYILYGHLLIEVNKVMEIPGVSQRTAYYLIDDLEKLRILKEITGGKRDRLNVFDDYIKLFN